MRHQALPLSGIHLWQDRAKLVRRAALLLGMALMLLPLLVIRLLRPLVTVRFGRLDTHGLGGFTAIPEIYLCERDAGMYGGRVLDLFCHTRQVCNEQLKKMWDRRLRVWPFVSPLMRLNGFIPGGEAHLVPWHPEEDIHFLLGVTPPHVSFTRQEERRGAEELERLGVPAGNPFVCFHARDSAYLKTVFPAGDLSNHDYRDSSIENYLPAVEELAARGYYCLRMGAIVESALPAANQRVIDYANAGRTDFMDMYLGGTCDFFIVSATGMNGIPLLFRRPIVLVNLIPLDCSSTWVPGQLLIPKKLWSREKGRYLTFSEFLARVTEFRQENNRILVGHNYAASGIDVVENTPDEISAVCLEMDARLKGTWETTEEDEELQERFWSLFEQGAMKSKDEFLVRIGAEFLRQNRELLD